jgi:hypothetical protein
MCFYLPNIPPCLIEHFLVRSRNLEVSVDVNLQISYSLGPSIIPLEDAKSSPSFVRVKIKFDSLSSPDVH